MHYKVCLKNIMKVKCFADLNKLAGKHKRYNLHIKKAP
ncbi:hypothetical protein PCARR_a3541 [Pseudoalteromonas carrageenovora IAM 12662]|uniref:Transposase n=1 Tax=Pseudoalteromonas carrageenovora IAM 12662 TaxID=1314868 RepID=A0ABR9EQ91_PSEVC|nr:hypothetical protein [Pseudoalteromonas carrageenovora IAM 12662]